MFTNVRTVSRALAVIALANSVLAGVFITSPSGLAGCHGGQKCTVTWLDDGTAPLLAAVGETNFALYFDSTKLVQQLGPVDVASTHSFTFTPNPAAGPNSATYYIQVTSQSAKDPNDSSEPYRQYSGAFKLDGMTGSANSPVPSLTSTIPPSGSTTSGTTSGSVSTTTTTASGATSTVTSGSTSGSKSSSPSSSGGSGSVSFSSATSSASSVISSLSSGASSASSAGSSASSVASSAASAASSAASVASSASSAASSAFSAASSGLSTANSIGSSITSAAQSGASGANTSSAAGRLAVPTFGAGAMSLTAFLACTIVGFAAVW